MNFASLSSSVYNNKKWTKYRASVGRVCETGDEFRKLQLEMAVPRPSRGLDRLPEDGTYELLTCIRCGHIPNPRNYMICEENGHHLCNICAAAPTMDGGGQQATKKYLKEKVSKLESCCAYRNLKKGSPRLLEMVLKSAMWTCQNERYGCNEVLRGLDMDEHLLVCRYRPGIRDQDQRKLPCYFQGCASVKDHPSARHLVKHYKEQHGAFVTEVAEGMGVGLKVDYAEIVEKRHISVLKLKDSESYLTFACEFCRETEVLHMWIWNMSDTSKKGKAPARSTRGNKVNNNNNVEGGLFYNLKLTQVRECEGLKTGDLTFDAPCLPHTFRPREIMETYDANHVRIGMEQFFNSCVEDTPNGNGLWKATLRFEMKKEEFCD